MTVDFQSFQLGRECARSPHATRFIGLRHLAEVRAMTFYPISATTDGPEERDPVIAKPRQSPDEAR